MAHDVFISHSSQDKATADSICRALENNGIKCWIAPRDVSSGAEYAGEIMSGIENSKVFLLVFSENSNASDPVSKELENAFRYGKTVIPFRIEDTPMRKSLEYYLSNLHWLNAVPGDEDYSNLVSAVRSATVVAAPSLLASQFDDPKTPDFDLPPAPTVVGETAAVSLGKEEPPAPEFPAVAETPIAPIPPIPAVAETPIAPIPPIPAVAEMSTAPIPAVTPAPTNPKKFCTSCGFSYDPLTENFCPECGAKTAPIQPTAPTPIQPTAPPLVQPTAPPPIQPIAPPPVQPQYPQQQQFPPQQPYPPYQGGRPPSSGAGKAIAIVIGIIMGIFVLAIVAAIVIPLALGGGDPEPSYAPPTTAGTANYGTTAPGRTNENVNNSRFLFTNDSAFGIAKVEIFNTALDLSCTWNFESLTRGILASGEEINLYSDTTDFSRTPNWTLKIYFDDGDTVTFSSTYDFYKLSGLRITSSGNTITATPVN